MVTLPLPSLLSWTVLIATIHLSLLTKAEQLSSNSRVGFWHVTDFHFNPDYIRNGDVAKKYCHKGNIPGMEILGEFGNFWCDTPWSLVQSAVEAMWKFAPKPDFILWTGDSAPHLPDTAATTDTVLAVIGNVTRTIESRFPDTPLYPSFGNHDYWPTDQFPSETNSVYEHAADLWSKHLNSSEAERTLRSFGYYKLQLKRPKDTVLLSLNTVLYYDRNRHVEQRVADPGGQFQLMTDELQKAREAGSHVIIAAHIPPGSWEKRKYSMTSDFNKKFVELVASYSDVICGIFFGHLHRDVYMLVKSPAEGNQFVSTILSAPAVVPCNDPEAAVVEPGDRPTAIIVNRNPAIRYVELDEISGDLRLLRQYYLNLTAANTAGVPQWKLQYSWEIPEGTSSLHFLTEKLEEIQKSGEALEEHLDRLYVMARPRPECQAACHRKHICGISELDFQAYDSCLTGGRNGTTGAVTMFFLVCGFIVLIVMLKN